MFWLLKVVGLANSLYLSVLDLEHVFQFKHVFQQVSGTAVGCGPTTGCAEKPLQSHCPASNMLPQGNHVPQLALSASLQLPVSLLVLATPLLSDLHQEQRMHMLRYCYFVHERETDRRWAFQEPEVSCALPETLAHIHM